MKGLRITFISGLLLYCTNIYAETTFIEKFSNIKPEGSTIIAAKLNGIPISIILITHEIDIGKPSDRRPSKLISNCTYSRYPCSVIDSLQIRINNKELFVPRSVFADLADINGAHLTPTNEGYVLTLDCGDASDSYNVKIFFNKKMINKRSMTSNETKKIIQKTTYFLP